MKALLPAVLCVLISCVTDADRQRSYEEFQARSQEEERVRDAEREQRYERAELARQEAEKRSLHAAGGYGPEPTKVGVERAVQAVRDSCKNPASFELIRVDQRGTFTFSETDSSHSNARKNPYLPENRGVKVPKRCFHGWLLYVHYRATNSYGGVVPGQQSVLVREDMPIYAAPSR